MLITPAARAAMVPAPPDRVTGDVWFQPLGDASAAARVLVDHMHFAPGARTVWHRRPLRQILYVTEGIGLVQQRGGPVHALRRGDAVDIAPGEWHWHGASPTYPMTGLAIEEMAADCGRLQHGAPVTDAEYQCRPAGLPGARGGGRATSLYAKQYEIALPADYEMAAIRRRVALAAPALDNRPGLGMKAYLIRERGVHGSPVNEYAPFYLWQDTGAMSEFLSGGAGFERVIRSFGRPAVRCWTGVAAKAGPARGEQPRIATRRLTTLPADPDAEDTGSGLSRSIQREVADLDTLSRRGGVHTAALAVDPGSWQLVRFVLWSHSAPPHPDPEATEHYEVLHLSAPGLADLPQGLPG